MPVCTTAIPAHEKPGAIADSRPGLPPTPRLPALLSALREAWTHPHQPEAQGHPIEPNPGASLGWMFSRASPLAPPSEGPPAGLTKDDAVSDLPVEGNTPTSTPSTSTSSTSLSNISNGTFKTDSEVGNAVHPKVMESMAPLALTTDNSSGILSRSDTEDDVSVPPLAEQSQGPATEQPGSPSMTADDDFEEMEVIPAPVLSTRLVIGGSNLPQASPSSALRVTAADWLSGFFVPRKQQQLPGSTPTKGMHYEAFNEKTFQARMEEQGRAIEADEKGNGEGSSYYR